MDFEPLCTPTVLPMQPSLEGSGTLALLGMPLFTNVTSPMLTFLQLPVLGDGSGAPLGAMGYVMMIIIYRILMSLLEKDEQEKDLESAWREKPCAKNDLPAEHNNGKTKKKQDNRMEPSTSQMQPARFRTRRWFRARHRLNRRSICGIKRHGRPRVQQNPTVPHYKCIGGGYHDIETSNPKGWQAWFKGRWSTSTCSSEIVKYVITKGVATDGNCVWRALAHMVNINWKRLKKMSMRTMRRSHEIPKSYLNYIAAMGIWADAPAIMAAAHTIHRSIWMIDEREDGVLIHRWTINDEYAPPIILYAKEGHCSPVINGNSFLNTGIPGS